MHVNLALTFLLASLPLIFHTWLIVLARGGVSWGHACTQCFGECESGQCIHQDKTRGSLSPSPFVFVRRLAIGWFSAIRIDSHLIMRVDAHRRESVCLRQLRETELPVMFRLFSAFTFHQRIHLDSSKERQYALSGLY